MITLDLDAVRAFVLVADLHSFTRAASALDTTQSAISLKLKRLENRLGYRLLERTPRTVRLCAAGAMFLGPARDLLEAHERTLNALSGGTGRRLTLGLSEHVADANLARLLARLRVHDPDLVIELHTGLSAALLAQFDERRFDAVVVRHESLETLREDARLLFCEPLVWLASPDWQWLSGTPLPLALLAAPCTVRTMALQALDAADVAWREVFVGGSVSAIGAALEAGLAVSPLARRVAPYGLADVGPRLGLPAFPASQIVLYSRVREPRLVAALQRFTASLAP